jgi:hypothetical protein
MEAIASGNYQCPICGIVLQLVTTCSGPTLLHNETNDVPAERKCKNDGKLFKCPTVELREL